MFITPHFIFLHLPKTAGVYVESVCVENLRMPILSTRRHAKFADLPVEFANLPTIGVWRDPWDWYASLYFFAKGQRNSATSEIVALASEGFALSFEDTLPRLLDPDSEFLAAYASRMRELGGRVADFECLDERSLERAKDAGLGLMGFLAKEIFPPRLDFEWRVESLRKDLFAYLSPLVQDRVLFRSAMVSPPRNASHKPTLEWIYSPTTVAMVARREAALISQLGYAPPRIASRSGSGQVQAPWSA